MAVEITLSDLDISGEFETKEDALKAIHEKYVAREVAPMDKDLKKQITGRVLGEITTHAKRTFGLQNSDVQDLRLEDVISKAAESYESKIKELEEKSGGQPDEKSQAKIQELQAKIQQKDQELMERNQKLEETEQEWQGKFTKYKVKDKLNRTLSGIPLVDMDPIQRKGWEATLSEVDWRMNDEGELRPYKEDEPIKNQNGTGLLSAKEYLESLASEANLIKRNDKNDRQTPYTWQNNGPKKEEPAKPGQKGFVHPKLVERANATRS